MIPAGAPLGAVQVTMPGAPVIGQVAPGGQLVNLGSLSGWWDPPASSGARYQKPNDHGSYVGPAYYTERVIGMLVNVDGFSPGDSMAVARQVMTAVSLDALASFTVTDELGTLMAQVRQDGDPLMARVGNRVTFSLSLVAPDPRRYGATQTASTGLPTSSGGLSLPLILPLSLGATASSGLLTVNNTGDMESFPVFTALGPLNDFTITEIGTGRQLVSANVIPAGRTLVIDTAAKTALLDGVATRTVTGTWPRLGANTDGTPRTTQFAFSSSTYDPAAQLSITYRSARR